MFSIDFSLKPLEERIILDIPSDQEGFDITTAKVTSLAGVEFLVDQKHHKWLPSKAKLMIQNPSNEIVKYRVTGTFKKVDQHAIQE